MKVKLLVVAVVAIVVSGLGFAAAAAATSHPGEAAPRRSLPVLSNGRSFNGSVVKINRAKRTICVRRDRPARRVCGFAFLPIGTKVSVGMDASFTVGTQRLPLIRPRQIVLLNWEVLHG